MEIINYKLRDFLVQDITLIEEYANILRLVEPIPTVNKLQDLKLREVEFIKKNIGNQQAIPRIFNYMEGINEDKVMDMTITTFYGLMNSIVKQLENLLGMEEQHLTANHSDMKWEAVDGSKRLSVLGILPMVDNLAGGDILKYEQILDLPYLTVFNRLRMDVIKADIQHDISKLKIKTQD